MVHFSHTKPIPKDFFHFCFCKGHPRPQNPPKEGVIYTSSQSGLLMDPYEGLVQMWKILRTRPINFGHLYKCFMYVTKTIANSTTHTDLECSILSKNTTQANPYKSRGSGYSVGPPVIVLIFFSEIGFYIFENSM